MLERFVEVARATCEMAGTLRTLPVSKDRRLAIYLQKKREDEALAGYQKASHALLDALEVHADLPDFEPVPQPIPAGKSRGARLGTRRRRTVGEHPRTGT